MNSEAWRKGFLSLFVVVSVCASVACGSTEPTPTVAPIPTQPGQLPVLEITASVSPQELRVGEDFTVTTDAGGSGIPQYTLSIDRRLNVVTRYDGTLVSSTEDARFEFVGWAAGDNSATWTFRALEAGDYEITLFVSGEVGVTPTGPFSFRSDSEMLQLSVLPAS